MSVIKLKIRELVLLRDDISKREQDLSISMKKLDEAKKNIINILKEANGTSDSSVFLDLAFFEKIKSNSISLSARFNWKEVTEKILFDYKSELTTKNIYEKAKLLYPIELADEKKSIHAFSSALSYLLKNNRIIQNKNLNKTYYKIIKKTAE